MLHRKFPEDHISGSLMGLMYRRFKIKRKVVMIKKFSNLKTKAKMRLQIKEARDQLQECTKKGQCVYFLDECMFTTRTY